MSEPEDLPLDIVYEDDYFLIVNKPRGILVQNDGKATTLSLDKMVLQYLLYKGKYKLQRHKASFFI